LPVFLHFALLHLPSKRLRHPVQTVADAEHGNAECEDFWVRLRTPPVVDALRPAGEDDAGCTFERCCRSLRITDFRKNTQPPDTAPDEVGVLSAAVEDDNALWVYRAFHGASVTDTRQSRQTDEREYDIPPMPETPTPPDTSAESSAGLPPDEGDTPVVVEVNTPPDAHTLAELFELAAQECQTIAERTAKNRGKMGLTEWRREFRAVVMATRVAMVQTVMILAKKLPGTDLKRHSAEAGKALRALETYQAEIRAAVRAGLSAEETEGADAAPERAKLDAAADRLAELQREMEKGHHAMLAIDDVQRTEAERDAKLSEREAGSSAGKEDVPEFTVATGIEVNKPVAANPPPRKKAQAPAPAASAPATKPKRRGWWPFGKGGKKK